VRPFLCGSCRNSKQEIQTSKYCLYEYYLFIQRAMPIKELFFQRKSAIQGEDFRIKYVRSEMNAEHITCTPKEQH
jgi:hypothetical protein